MKFFRRNRDKIEPVAVDIAAASADLSRSVNIHLDAQEQALRAREAAAGLARSRIRNGFAPAIEAGIIKRHLGGFQ